MNLDNSENRKTIYFSIDIEADGPYPLDYSMLSFGVSAHSEDGTLIGSFEANLDTLDGASQCKDTMEWWSKFPEAWAKCRENTKPPKVALQEFVAWVENLCEQYEATPTLIAYPAGFDFTFIYIYLMKFVGYSPFSFSCLDIKTYASAVGKTNFNYTTKRKFPKHWKSNKHKHNHVAFTDALGQAYMFFQMKKDNESAS